MHVQGDGCAFAGGHGQVGGHTAVVPPSVGVYRVDGEVALCGHPLPVCQHLLLNEEDQLTHTQGGSLSERESNSP